MQMCLAENNEVIEQIVFYALYPNFSKRIQIRTSRQFTLALTLGHTILGQSDASLDISGKHELVHVRQFERWGLLMGPAYIGCSLVLWLRGRNPYRDNPFEQEAYKQQIDT